MPDIVERPMECQARPKDEVLAELLDSRIAKTEREHVAAREIERLRQRVAELEDRAASFEGSFNACEKELAALKAGQGEAVAQCTNSDTWNCKYCNKTVSCKALKDPRNFTSAQVGHRPADLTIPEGWQLVPVEATPEMDAAREKAIYDAASEWDYMLAAAPKPEEPK